MSDYYDRNGDPIDRDEWARLFEDTDYKRVAYTEKDEVAVSTVWLGIDHNFMGGPPHIFETMVFGGDHNDFQQRYSTEALALFGHDEVCKRVFPSTDVLRS